MKKLVLALVLSMAAQAQATVTLAWTAPTAPCQAGRAITVPLTYASTTLLADLQFTLTTPVADITTVSLAATSLLTGAGKTLWCNSSTVPPAPAPVSTTCVVGGPNTTPIPAGAIANVTFTINPTTAAASTTVGWMGMLAADGAGVPLPGLPTSIVGTPLVINIASACDLNLDGKTDLADLALLAGQINGKAACSPTNGDLDKSGTCDLWDFERVRIATTGGVCVSGSPAHAGDQKVLSWIWAVLTTPAPPEVVCRALGTCPAQ